MTESRNHPYMDTYMELEKKTTILFPADMHEHLQRLAQKRGMSLGALVRNACYNQYGIHSKEERLKAVDELGELDLPVSDVKSMKKELNPLPRELIS